MLLMALLQFNFVSAQMALKIPYVYASVGKPVGFGITFSFEHQIKDSRFSLIPEIGYKALDLGNREPGASLSIEIMEAGASIGYPLAQTEKFKLTPQIGILLRRQKYHIALDSEDQQVGVEAWYIARVYKTQGLLVNRITGRMSDSLTTTRLGFTISLPFEFKLAESFWLGIGPMTSFDYDRRQNAGGGFVALKYYW